ncbi:MAG TPA: DUF983 domain-containing protein, partial [Pseudohaliea sp.]|nr:DUF983 domain-containing protein [Pseudohaliea sp.]
MVKRFHLWHNIADRWFAKTRTGRIGRYDTWGIGAKRATSSQRSRTNGPSAMPIHYRASHSTAIRRGLKRRCPSCGEGRAFAGYLRTAEACGRCGTPLGQIRADDFPPYLTIFVVGHIVVPLLLMVEQTYQWPYELHMLVWPALT